MLTEMILLMIIARKLYKRIIPDPECKIQISTIGAIMTTEMCNNNSLIIKNQQKGVDNAAYVAC